MDSPAARGGSVSTFTGITGTGRVNQVIGNTGPVTLTNHYHEGPSRFVDEELTARMRLQKCERSLAFPSMNSRYFDISDREESTCDWVLCTPEYERWETREAVHEFNGVLWIKGNPGAGKSTIMKHALDQYRQQHRDHIILSYFYHARGDPLERTPLGMYRSLTLGLISKNKESYERLAPVFSQNEDLFGNNWEWHEGQLKSFLLSEAKLAQARPITIFVDALDECIESNVRDVVRFLEKLSQEALDCHLREGSRGIHVVILVVELINQAYDNGNLSAASKVLEDIPDTLDKIFLDILQGCEHNTEAALLFQWALFSASPLKARELYAAIGLNGDEVVLIDDSDHTQMDSLARFIRSHSKGLIALARDWDGHGQHRIQFIHQSVRDFLLRKRRLKILDASLEDNPVGTSHDRLAQCCLQYLLSRQCSGIIANGPGENASLGAPFLFYTSNYLLHHANLAEENGISQAQILKLFLDEEFRERVRMLHKICGAELRDFDYMFGEPFMDVLVGAGYLALFQRLRSEFPQEPLSRSSLRTACRSGKLETVKALANAGADLSTCEEGQPTPLELAVLAGDEAVVELLLSAGADANAESAKYGSVLQAACCVGLRSILIMLLSAGADINASGGLYGGPLQAAASIDNAEIARVLIEAGADLNFAGGRYGTALQTACYRKATKVIEVLLEARADVNAVSGYYGTALQAACSRERDYLARTLERLLEAGADLGLQGGVYGNALSAACTLSLGETVRFLLEKGADVNIRGGPYGSPLMTALSYKRSGAARLILEAGADLSMVTAESDRLLVKEFCGESPEDILSEEQMRVWGTWD